MRYTGRRPNFDRKQKRNLVRLKRWRERGSEITGVYSRGEVSIMDASCEMKAQTAVERREIRCSGFN